MLDQLANGLLLGAVIAVTSIGLSLIFSVTNTLNFAHGDLVTTGGMIAVLLSGSAVGLPLWLALPGAVLAGVALGLVLDLSVFKPMRRAGVGGITMLVTTLGLALVVRYVILALAGPDPEGLPLPRQHVTSILGLRLTPLAAAVIVASVLLLVAVALFLLKSTTGTSMRAVSNNRALAAASGIDVERVTLVTWGMGGGLAAVGGVMLALTQLVYWDMGSQLLLLMFAGIILGGLGSAFGAMAGGFVVGVVTQLAVALPYVRDHTDLKLAVTLAVMTLVLLARPQGILGRKARLS
jgi:branched-chain amino acid transport system permease protein